MGQPVYELRHLVRHRWVICFFCFGLLLPGNTMDLSQTKLTRAEWATTEVPVSESERQVLSLILEGYFNTDIHVNAHQALLSLMRVEPTQEMNYLLFTKYFLPVIQRFAAPPSAVAAPAAAWLKSLATHKIKQPTKRDLIRIQNVNATVDSNRHAIFEFVLLDYALESAGLVSGVAPHKATYSLHFLRHRATVPALNEFVVSFVDWLLDRLDLASPAAVRQVFARATDIIEKNPALLKYADQTLYSHQRDLFAEFADPRQRHIPKCVLYIAPTGTGKTLSPLGLSQEYRVIFVCGARHVGLALAKAAISVGKRVAFAFGCATSSDIRLHYFAAADYVKHKKSGGIFKVDNSNGVRVEIMICDIASYLVAMYYMRAFNHERDLVTYWDEPTIGMDYEDHPLHPIIHQAWSKNQISKLVLSCATLPTADEIGGVLHDFRSKFFRHALAGRADEEGDLELDPAEEPRVVVIQSHDCKKTISLWNKDGQLALPHLLFSDYMELLASVEHCEKNKAFLRYMDIGEIVEFCAFVQAQLPADMHIATYFRTVDRVSLDSIKQYYLRVLKQLSPDTWPRVHQACVAIQAAGATAAERYNHDLIRRIQSECAPASVSASTTSPWMPGASSAAAAGAPLTRQASVVATKASVVATKASGLPQPPHKTALPGAGVLLTTADAHTLTDGPTIYLAEDVDKIGRFYIQQANIPESVFAVIQQKMDQNAMILRQIDKLEEERDAKLGTAEGGSAAAGTAEAKDRSKKAAKDPVTREMQQLLDRIAALKENIHTVHLSPVFVPNTKQHQDVWVPASKRYVKNAFSPNVDEGDVREIMQLDVSNQLKLLLILGIGVFSRYENDAYMEIMKRLAVTQRLFLIIASSDYIYGTNYQFCHGFIGKDLVNMTQQKTIQAIGRIGRNHIQQEYTVRFRDNDVLRRLFLKPERNLEAVVMNRLFVTDEDDMDC